MKSEQISNIDIMHNLIRFQCNNITKILLHAIKTVFYYCHKIIVSWKIVKQIENIQKKQNNPVRENKNKEIATIYVREKSQRVGNKVARKEIDIEKKDQDRSGGKIGERRRSERRRQEEMKKWGRIRFARRIRVHARTYATEFEESAIARGWQRGGTYSSFDRQFVSRVQVHLLQSTRPLTVVIRRKMRTA